MKKEFDFKNVNLRPNVEALIEKVTLNKEGGLDKDVNILV